MAFRRVAKTSASRNGFEACGALIRLPRSDLFFRPLRNLAREPAKWEIKTQWLTEIRRELKGTGSRLVGTYHSHVSGYAYPSVADKESFRSNSLMLIYDVVDGRVGLWRPWARHGKGYLKSLSVASDSFGWDEENAVAYARNLREKLKSQARRSD